MSTTGWDHRDSPIPALSGHSHGEEAAGVFGQPQAGQQADGENKDKEEEVGQPPGCRGRPPSGYSPQHPRVGNAQNAVPSHR